ncbi:MAG: class I SAM-dependent methyltransferase [Leptolyngbyaceae cyanobacterium bins.349]|nr:class I SAM-dependent methyltransferase [Leptolyngbyaceae cyanobacterium bins.349]
MVESTQENHDMNIQRSLLHLLMGAGLATVLGVSTLGQPELVAQIISDDPTQIAQDRRLDVPYVPTPQEVVDEMLRLANVQKADKLYDLGSGDGRIVVTAAQKFGTRGVGVDLDPERVQEANANARRAGVSDLVEFRRQDLFKTDLRQATVVTLYLLPEVNLRLRPKLLQELKPGTRIVSHAFDMGDWKPEKVVRVNGRTIYFWTVPAKTSGQPK